MCIRDSSSSNEKRGKGRRGLKLLKELRELYGRRLVINPTKYEGNGVDEKLLRITEDMAGTLITADYNLSQIAEVKELKVMNLSDLVIALRPEVQPGDCLLYTSPSPRDKRQSRMPSSA